MRTPPDVLLQWQTAFPHRRFYLFADSSVPDGTLPAQIERCTMEGWLTDSVASAKLLGWSVRPLPFHCTTLAMSCPAPRLAASVLGLLYSNRGGRAASALCAHRRPEGLEWRAHGAKRSAQPRNTGPIKAARCEDAERPLRIEDVAVAGGARSARPVGEAARSKPNEGVLLSSEAAKRLKPRGHRAKRSPQMRNTGPPKTARCEDAGRPLRIVDSLLPRPPACQKDFFDKLSSIRIIPQAAN